MIPILTAYQIRDVDQYTIKNTPIPSIDLMERAAQACVNWILERLQESKENYNIHIFCGMGNNGGDGLAIARLLLDKNITSTVHCVCFSPNKSEDFSINLERLLTMGVKINDISHREKFPCLNQNDIIIDAIFGSGLSRPIMGFTANLIEHINNSNALVISIDIPSGLYSSAQEGAYLHPIISASHTLTFQLPKLSFLLPSTGNYIGEFHILHIGLDKKYISSLPTNYFFVELNDVQSICKKRPKFSHKGSYGKALIMAGSHGMMGAAILSARACLHSGVGLLSMLIPEDENVIMQKSVPEAMTISSHNIDVEKFTSIALGPGIGKNEDTSKIVETILKSVSQPIILDADAINLLSENHHWFEYIPPQSILTPHPGEFKRLVGEWNSDAECVERLTSLAQHHQIYIILKGAHSMIATPNGDIYFNSTGNPGMATGGSGDVLTGMLVALLAQGYASIEASLLGVFLHGLSGDLSAQELTWESVTAGSIIQQIPNAFKTVQKRTLN
jgi:NAD(P)H-hydrate epimerase